MRRRDLLALAAGAAALRSLAASAQQAPNRIRHIGVLLTKAALTRSRIAAFEEGLRSLCWTQGANLRIDYRIVEANREQMRAAVKEVVALAPELIVVQTTPMTRELRVTTRTIPTTSQPPTSTTAIKRRLPANRCPGIASQWRWSGSVRSARWWSR